MNKLKCYLNGKIIPESEAQIGLNDLALLRGYGVFDYFVFERFQARFMEDNIDRFYRSAHHLGLECPVERTDVRQAIHQLIAANEQPSGAIRLVLTGGYTPNGYNPTVGNLFMLQTPRPVYPPEMYELGIRVATFQHQRELPAAKTLNYLTGISLLPWLKKQNADVALFHDHGSVRESDRSNFFMINANNTLITPKDDILEGITRSKILSIAPQLGLKVEVREILLEELKEAEEAFLTNATKSVMPVSVINGNPVGKGKPGPFTNALRQAFSELAFAHQTN